MLRLFLYRSRSGNDRTRVDKFSRAIGGSARFTIVSVLAGRLAFRAGTGDVAVGKKEFLLRVIELLDGSSRDMTIGIQLLENGF